MFESLAMFGEGETGNRRIVGKTAGGEAGLEEVVHGDECRDLTGNSGVANEGGRGRGTLVEHPRCLEGDRVRFTKGTKGTGAGGVSKDDRQRDEGRVGSGS